MPKLLYKFFISFILFALVASGPYSSVELLEQELISFSDFYNLDLISRSATIFNVVKSYHLLWHDLSCFIALAVFRLTAPVIAYPDFTAILFLSCLAAAITNAKSARFRIKSALRCDLILSLVSKLNLTLGFIASCQHYGSSCWLSAAFLGTLIPLVAAKISKKINLDCFLEDLN